MFFCMGSGRLRGAHRGASGQPGAPSTRGGKTAEAGAARGESVEFPRPGVEKSRKSKGLYRAKVHDISTWISTFSARELAEVQGAGPHYRDLLDI